MNEAMTAVVEVLGLLGWVVGHSLWQGALVGAVLWGLLRVCRGPEKRYWLSCGAMGVLMVMVGATAVYLGQGVERRSSGVAMPERGRDVPEAVLQGRGGEIRWVGTVTAGGIDAGVRERVPATVVEARGEEELSRDWVGLATVCGGVLWLVGVMGMAGVQIAGWRRVSRAMAGEDHAELTAVAERLMKKMGIQRRVRVLVERSWELGPGVVGWIKPVVLVPVSCATGLSSAQLEAVLAHELAHVKRNDYLVNLAVTAVETVLFHHPAVWWMGRVIRCERELCCDDLAREVCGGGRELAGALERIEEMRLEVGHRLVMGAGGVDGGEGSGLLERVRRLMGRMEDPMDVRVSKAVWMASAGGVVLVAVGCLAGKGDAKAAAESKPAEVATTTVEQAVIVEATPRQTGSTPYPARGEVTKSVPPLEAGSGFPGQMNATKARDVRGSGQADLDRQLAELDAARRELAIARAELAGQASAFGQSAAAARDSLLKDEARLAGIQAQGQANIEAAQARLARARSTEARSALERYPSASGQQASSGLGSTAGSAVGGVARLSGGSAGRTVVRGFAAVADEAYRVVPGDVLQVTVGDLARPGAETVRTVRVNELGQIQLPGVEGAVGLVGKSEEEARKVIAELYSAAGVNVKAADVTVSVVERKGWVVLVVGEVGTPGEVVLSKPEVRLLDVMARVKGATENAAGKVIVVGTDGERQEVRLGDLMEGKVEADVPVRAGDRVIVPGDGFGITVEVMPSEDVEPAPENMSEPIEPVEPIEPSEGVEANPEPAPEIMSEPAESSEPVERAGAEEQVQDCAVLLGELRVKQRDLMRTEQELRRVLETARTTPGADVYRVAKLEKLLDRLGADQKTLKQEIAELAEMDDSEVYYIGGNVQRSGAYKLGSADVSVRQAIIAAGAALPADREGIVSVTRRWADGESETAEFALADVMAGKHDEVMMSASSTLLLVNKPGQGGASTTQQAEKTGEVRK